MSAKLFLSLLLCIVQSNVFIYSERIFANSDYFVKSKNDQEKPKATPKLVVFDLDYTLWPFWIDINVHAPLRKDGEVIKDLDDQHIRPFPDVLNIFKKLKAKKVKIGVASRTTEIETAHKLIKLLGWEKYFDYVEIFPDEKTTHFKKMKSASGLKYKDMLFFDDESRNISDVEKTGVTCIFVENGMTFAHLEQGFNQWRLHNLEGSI